MRILYHRVTEKTGTNQATATVKLEAGEGSEYAKLIEATFIAVEKPRGRRRFRGSSSR